ncbi:Stk1 family PASTA domain-containing Ser/Thr kinase [Streptomyces phaeofaciens JCM 4814]|uniref:non-specific serine/threonine protein kinase n=1 Tax=Streptomyces phaeofaciens TaxID=68254 RepID=A0A918H8K1_9ACTN|nr:PASTA domain-containing protein [Streptomyces phaeofaciens]GGT45057.1 serine/threonine-protein kinase PknB [Streptomyces phaeofaciens]
MNFGGADGPTFPGEGFTPGGHPAGHTTAQADAAHRHPAPFAFGGRYELGRLLGRGGMAEVHLAHDTRLDRVVAVKTLRADLTHDADLQARFRREAQSTASLNHPAIAAVYDTGEDLGHGADGGAVALPYLVMEYVDGMPLSDALFAEPALTPDRVLELTEGVLQALAHSHRQGIVHRDIKPANVMVTRTGQVKVMDFGIARDLRDAGLTRTSMVIGTAQYLSPEQALGEEIDARSDLYSVGCLLYELLTYRPPFVDESPMAVMYRHVQEAPQPPSLFNPLVTPAVDALVLRALEKDRAHRHRSAEEMLDEIGACLGRRTFAPAVQPPQQEDDSGADDRGGRRATVALLVAAAAVVVLAIGLGWFMLGRGPADDGRVDVPALVGQTLDDARRAADNVGLTVTVTAKEPCEDQPKGHVCTQSPADGRLAEGEAVALTVSTGSPEVEVPDVLDKDEDDASRILADKGFQVTTRHVESAEETGTVLDQDPDGGEKAERGGEITLTVAKEAARSTVPDLVGRTVDEATELLAEHDLELGDTTRVESDATAGTVIGQSEREGAEVDPGTTVDVQVAEAKETVEIPGDIVGGTLAEVRGELAGLGLGVSVASGSSQASDAVVTSSTPTVGSEVARGSTVIVVTEETPSGDEESTQGASPSPTTGTTAP